jgi:hypothetical protein
MTPRSQLTGKVVGKLKVIKFHSISSRRESLWECLCECGSVCLVSSAKLISSNTKSCGCLKFKHGESSNTGDATKEYNVWATIKERCHNPNCRAYKWYGGRGIKMCHRWLNSYETFLADIGRAPSPKHSADRYPNNDAGYEPGNFRWATRAEQARNTRRNRWLEYKGQLLVVSDWAAVLNLSPTTIAKYVRNGKSIADIIEHFKIQYPLIRHSFGYIDA